MVRTKRLAQLAKKRQRMAVNGRKRLTRIAAAATAKGADEDECCATLLLAGKG